MRGGEKLTSFCALAFVGDREREAGVRWGGLGLELGPRPWTSPEKNWAHVAGEGCFTRPSLSFGAKFHLSDKIFVLSCCKQKKKLLLFFSSYLCFSSLSVKFFFFFSLSLSL